MLVLKNKHKETVQPPLPKFSLDIEKLLEDYGYKDSYKTWRRSYKPRDAEDRLLRMLPFYPDGDERRRCEVLDVDIGDKKHIHEFYIENLDKRATGETIERDVVLVHGYGNAMGVYIRNFDELSQIPGIRLHAIDMLGYGLSARPDFPLGNGLKLSYLCKKKDVTLNDVEDAISFFVDSFEAWREKRGLKKFVLIAHSLGGYLSSLYSIRYPERVEKLILISPVGVEKSIFELNPDCPAGSGNSSPLSSSSGSRTDGSTLVTSLDSAPSSSSADKTSPDEGITTKSNSNCEGQPTQEELGPDIAAEFKTNPTPNSTDLPSKLAQKSSSFHIPDENGYVEKIPNLPGPAKIVWEMNISPFAVIRNVGPLGPKICANWSFRRFAHCGTLSEISIFHDYVYSSFNLKGSGEYAITTILAPGALARLPLLTLLPGSIRCDTLWIYGDRDWMSKEAGQIIVDKISKETSTKAEFVIVKDAGHHVYLDSTPEFNQLIIKTLHDLWDEKGATCL